MKKLFPAIFAFALVACGTAAPAPTAAPTAAALPPTATLAPTVTAIPTEIPLPEGPIADLQKQIGDKFKITQVEGSKDTFKINGMENLKFNADGTAELEFNGEKLTVAPQVILPEGDNLNIGPWQLGKEGEVTMLVAGAPKTVEDVAKFPKLAIDESLSPERQKAIDLTIHKYVSMATEKRGDYDPAVEFENVYFEGEKIESEVSEIYQSYSEGGVTYLDNPPNEFIGIASGYATLEIYGSSGIQEMDLKLVPILVRNTNGTIFSMVGLVEQDSILNMIDQKIFSATNRGSLYPILTSSGSIESEHLAASVKLQVFTLPYNQQLLTEVNFEPNMNLLPQGKLSQMGYWVFQID